MASNKAKTKSKAKKASDASKKASPKSTAKTKATSGSKKDSKRDEKSKESTKASKRIIIILLVVIAVLACVYGALRYITTVREEQRQEILNSNTFQNGIKINGIDIGGKTPEEAKALLEQTASDMTKDILLTITANDENFVASSKDLGIITNIDELVIGTAETPAVLSNKSLFSEELSLSDVLTEIEDINTVGRNYTLSLTLDTDVTNAYLDTLSNTLGETPTNATFSVKEIAMSETKGIDAYDTVNIGMPEDGSVTDIRDLRFDFVEGKDGIVIDRETFISQLKERIANNDFSYFELPAQITPASVTIADIKEKLVLRASFSTSYASGNYGRSTRVHNMTKATGLIYGTVLQPNEQFSANTILGYRTLASGWQLAPAVIDGGAANEDQPGGGVCQVSSTIYQAVLKADYQIDYRQAHSSKLGYVKGGLDATIDSGRIDFTWTNNTSSPVYIFTWIDKEKKEVWCELYGEPFSGEFDEIELISVEQDPIMPTASEYIESSSLTAPYWQLKNASKKGYVFKTYKSYLKDGVEIERELITTTTYKMHPARYYVWPGYLGEDLLPEFEIKPEE